MGKGERDMASWEPQSKCINVQEGGIPEAHTQTCPSGALCKDSGVKGTWTMLERNSFTNPRAA